MLNYSSRFMIYSGVNFKTCPIEYREALSLIANSENVKKSIFKITQQEFEFVNIATCNRFDICLFGSLTKKQLLDIFYDLYSEYVLNQSDEFHANSSKLTCISKIELHDFSKYLQFYIDKEAIKYLFRVTASLDSLVLGEQQILGQVKASYLNCVEQGYAKRKAHLVFNHNFKVAKKIRTQTDIAKNSISVGHAAIEMIYKVFDELKNKKILIIGAGNMSKIIVKNFLARGAKYIQIANRSIKNAENLAQELSLSSLDLIVALDQLHQYDICIVAAGGHDYIVTEDILKNYNKKRLGDLTVFIDVSVPRKISPLANQIDNIFLFYIDDLSQVMEKNKELRSKSAIEAEKIIEEEVGVFLTRYHQKESLQHVAKMNDWLNNIISYEVDRYFYDLSRGKKSGRQVIADSVTKKIISNIAQLSKRNHTIDFSSKSIGEIVDILFNLSNQEEKKFIKKNGEDNIFQLYKKGREN